jgi:hypothetical protein
LTSAWEFTNKGKEKSMSRKPIDLLALPALAAMLLLSACGGGAATATATPDAYAQGAPTQAAASPTGAVATLAAPDFEKSCTAVSGIFPTPDPTQAAVQSLFAPVSDQDWTLGEQTAAVTFLEYGDFQ